jgi:NADPH:quinone reductase-like Zn-dependent oxidoreductase
VEGGFTMLALVADEKGGPEQLDYRDDIPLPYVGIGDVLVRVHAASFTPTELSWPSTWVDRLGRDRRPIIPGHEVCGAVEALGSGTTGFEIGDVVYGLTDWYRNGAAAEYVAVEVRNLAAKPASLDYVHSAAIPMPGLTAWQALFVQGELTSGQAVLILGAGGGVGSFAVQLAHQAGARVIGTGHSSAADLAKKLGADEFINIDTEELHDVVQDVDLVVDLVGGEAVVQSQSAVRSGGRIVSLVEEKPSDGGRADLRAKYFVVEPQPAQLAEIARRIDDGELRPVLGDVVPLSDGRKAFEVKRDPGHLGKSVLQVSD